MADPSASGAVVQGDGLPMDSLQDKGFESLGKPMSLCLKWDNDPLVRQRLREGWNLVVNYDTKLKRASNNFVQHTVHNVKYNACVLRPVCQEMSKLRLVNIENLEDEVRQVHSLYNSLVSDQTMTEQAWAIRHLVSVLKSTIRVDKRDSSRTKRCPKDIHVSVAHEN